MITITLIQNIMAYLPMVQNLSSAVQAGRLLQQLMDISILKM